jgi:MFS superfamily sulfate permease-like transporter
MSGETPDARSAVFLREQCRLDFAATMLKELIGELHEAGVALAFARATTGLIHDLERNGLVKLVGDEHFFDTVAAGVDEFLHHSQPRLG